MLSFVVTVLRIFAVEGNYAMIFFSHLLVQNRNSEHNLSVVCANHSVTPEQSRREFFHA
jgi:hypothetical protein